MNCKLCSTFIYSTELLKCTSCKSTFHHNCVNITTAKYMADYATLKNPFTCESCTQDIGGQEEQEDICYVTQRKPRRKVNSESNESMFEMSYQSLPNLCQQNNQDLEELKDENLKLKIELEAAHIEIESLNTQIQTLDCDKKELDRKLQLFRSVGLGTTNTIYRQYFVTKKVFLTPISKNPHGNT